ncbi:MAG: hypothetical protein E2O71_07395 [Deltaproteobacteria bacterium]|nr:MAG: hypothetical protein E2O71_07395 [Deltaproteobacteria bacterium]
MPNSHHIAADEGLALVSIWGPAEVESAVQAIQELAQDPRFEPHFNVLIDAHALDDGEAELEHVEAVADSLTDLSSHYRGKLAIVCRVGAHFDLLKLMCAYAGSQGMRVRAFTEPAQAKAWLTQAN